jgi:acetyl/propionyl-CoA carboxylase alpha subunit/acetyl-CoA carboxylase carboxyltransferase component
MSFTRVAVLNRGDAAMRFLRTARELADGSGPVLDVVAVFTDPDANAPFVRLADDAIGLGPALQTGSDGVVHPAYCLHDLVIERLLDAGVEAVWPGWGFVSEDAAFVDRLDAAGITFIGPPAHAMRALGDKVRSKLLAEQCGVPLAPWSALDLDADPSTWVERAEEVGFPVMVKAAHGGGGRGIRRVDAPEQVVAAVRAVRAEADAAFGEGQIFLEQCVEQARHVEVQFVVGVDGRADTLGVRDCSIQRRHQKVIEEAPSPVLSPVEEARLTASTARLAEAAGYRGVGTAEFLYVPSERVASFCEVNARLQVEHTVTELVWGVDLVRAQIEIALGRTHERSAGPRGWAVEARVVAEDAERGFAPAPGRVLVHRPAAGPNVRVDAGIRAGSDIPAEFDSMIAKVLAWGPTRDRALATLTRAVREYEVLVSDGATNRGVLLDLLGRPEVVDASATTTWLESVHDLGATGRERGTTVALAVAAIELAAADRRAHVERFFADARSGVPAADRAATRPVEVELSLRGEAHRLSVRHLGGTRWSVGPRGRELEVHLERLDDHAVVAQIDGRSLRVLVNRGSSGVTVDVEGTLHRVQETDMGVVRAPGPALVVAVSVEVGDLVEAGQRIGTLESMKTEAPLLADVAGEVERVLVPAGTQVAAGEPIIVLRPADEGHGDATSDAAAAERRWPVRSVSDAERVLDVVDAVLRGLEVAADDVADAVERLDAVARSTTDAPDGIDAERWAPLVDRLGTFVATEALFERNLLLLDDHSAAISAEAAFHDLCRRHGDGPGAVLPELVPLLGAALSSHGVIDVAGPDATEALWRLAATRARVAERERLTISVLRALAALVRAGSLAPTEFVSHLAEVERVATGSMAALADAAVLVRAEMDTDRGGAHAVPASQIDPATIAGLERYHDVQISVLDAVVTAAGRSVVAKVVSSTDPADTRTVLAIELADAPEDLTQLSEEQIAPFAELFEVGVGLLRTRREEHSAHEDRDTWWAALHLVLRGARTGDPASLLSLTHRFESGTRGLALQDFTVALVPRGGSVTAEGVTEFSMRRRGHARLEIDASDHMLAARPRSDLDRRALTAKRLGVVDPWELIGLLQGRVRGDDLPHPSLAEGRFVEHDLVVDDAANGAMDPDRLVPVDRAPAQHRSSVIVGIVANPLPGRTEWAERVLVLGDPLRSMGSLGEAECRRLIAALDLAEQRGLRLEWVTLSSGARIAWDSGTENLDWTAAVLRRIVEFTTAGGEIDVIVAGVNVGAQSYWNAEATMLMHTRGVLVMVPTASMVLTGKRALEFSGSVGAQDEIGIGGHDRIMGPNGQSQYRADDLAGAYAILLDHHALTLAARDEGRGGRAPRLVTTDPHDRDVCVEPYKGGDEGFATVGEIFDPATNPGRKRPFAVRAVMGAVVDADAPRMERWRTMADADGAVVWESRIGGFPVSLIGIESRPRARVEAGPIDGPTEWAGGTLYPASSKKVARALRAASGSRAAVVLANLSGFDGSPESLRRLQLEYGAEIARAVVEFDGPVVFVVIGRYHGGAYVVFSKRLNHQLTALAVEGSYASVIGGAPAAAVVLTRDVRARLAADTEVLAARAALDEAERDGDADRRLRRIEELDQVRVAATARARAAVAAEFDAVHTVDRAVQVGSLDAVIGARELRPRIVEVLEGTLGEQG